VRSTGRPSEGPVRLECLRFNVGRTGFHPLSLVTASLPFDHIAFDLIQLKTSVSGFNFILLIVDIFTQLVILKALQRKTAEDIAWSFLEVFANFGVPKIMQSDNDPSFLNRVMNALREAAGYQSREVLKYFPSQNRAAERYVAEVKKVILKMTMGDLSEWEKLLPVTQIYLNNRVIDRHISCPFSLFFGRKCNGFEDYRGTESKPLSEEEMMARNKLLIEEIFPEVDARSRKKAGAMLDKRNAKEIRV